jgi:hypothetical protein
MTTEQSAKLKEDLQWALGGFARWMNRPVKRVQVYTWHLFCGVYPKAVPIRYRPAYRDFEIREYRRLLAQVLRECRRAGHVRLPIYNEAKAIYEPLPTV